MTPEQVSQYKETGYATVPGSFAPDEVAAPKSEVDRRVEQGLTSDVSVPDARRNLQLIPLWPHSRLFRALPFHPKVLRAVSALLGDPVVKILDQMFYKPPHTGTGTNWHTDNAYFHLGEPLRGCATWVGIDDATRENGTLKVVPGVSDREFPHERDPESDHHIRTHIANGRDRKVHCELEAGGVVFFCFGTPHVTGPNPTGFGRAGVGLHFINFDYANEDMRGQRRWQHVFLTGDQATASASLSRPNSMARRRVDDSRSDNALIAACNAASASEAARAFEVLYRRHKDFVLRVALRFVPDTDTALDVLQETFMYLLGRFPPTGTGIELTAKRTTLLYPVAKNTALTMLRRSKRFPTDGVEPDELAAATAEQTMTDDVAAAVGACPPGNGRCCYCASWTT